MGVTIDDHPGGPNRVQGFLDWLDEVLEDPEERAEIERKIREEAERKAKEEAERKAKEEAERKAKEEAERKAKEEAERKAKEEADRKAREEAERKAKEEADRKAKEEAEKKAKEAERKAKEEADRKAKEEADLKAKEDAERKAKEETERKVKEEAERKAKETVAKKAKGDAAKQDQVRGRIATQRARRTGPGHAGMPDTTLTYPSCAQGAGGKKDADAEARAREAARRVAEEKVKQQLAKAQRDPELMDDFAKQKQEFEKAREAADNDKDKETRGAQGDEL
jgi:hypothetical protein